MRILIIVLLLVLTPLRAWAADSMAVQMASQGLGSHTGESAVEELSAHCLGMQENSPESPAEPADHSSLCGNCAACQVCATVALVAPASAQAATEQVHHLPWTAGLTFSSAALAPGQKPPIF